MSPAIPIQPGDAHQGGCQGCRNSADLEIGFDFAFQPIVNIRERTIFAHEALVRGPAGESAASVLQQVTEANRYAFDQACRVKAVHAAAALGMQELLSINFLPNAVYEPAACIRSTLAACEQSGFPTQRIMFEVTEGERVDDRPHLLNIFESYRRFGFVTAIDDFGAGYAGLSLLSDFQPHVLKIDMDLVRDIDRDRINQAIVSGIVHICRQVGSRVVAEGVETRAELLQLQALGIELVQGYYFCKPVFRGLGQIDAQLWP